MPNEKISLVIPAYNEEKYIGSCLECAIKNSNGKFFEIIVVDNASTDRTAEVAARQRGVRVVREGKKGLTRARQRGFQEAKGDLIAYFDADTQMPAGWVEKATSEFQKDPKLVCLSGPYLYYDIPVWQQSLSKFYANILVMAVQFIFGYVINGGNFIIRRETLERMNGFDTSIEFYGEDANVARRAHEFGKVRFDLRLVMPTSGRRLNGQGALKTSFLYVSNYLSEALFHRPAHKKYTDIR